VSGSGRFIRVPHGWHRDLVGREINLRQFGLMIALVALVDRSSGAVLPLRLDGLREQVTYSVGTEQLRRDLHHLARLGQIDEGNPRRGPGAVWQIKVIGDGWGVNTGARGSFGKPTSAGRFIRVPWSWVELLFLGGQSLETFAAVVAIVGLADPQTGELTPMRRRLLIELISLSGGRTRLDELLARGEVQAILHRGWADPTEDRPAVIKVIHSDWGVGPGFHHRGEPPVEIARRRGGSADPSVIGTERVQASIVSVDTRCLSGPEAEADKDEDEDPVRVDGEVAAGIEKSLRQARATQPSTIGGLEAVISRHEFERLSVQYGGRRPERWSYDQIRAASAGMPAPQIRSIVAEWKRRLSSGRVRNPGGYLHRLVQQKTPTGVVG
jgi:hypothetical protein